MTKRLCVLVVLPVLAGATTFVAGYSGFPNYVFALLRGDPRVDAPEVVELLTAAHIRSSFKA